MKKLLFLLVFAAFGTIGYSQQVTAEAAKEAVKSDMAVFAWESQSHDFGKIKQGVPVTHEFKFTNKGKVPLVITNGSSTCGCTVPEWPKEAIKPGGKGTIKVKFDSQGKAGPQAKPITIVANTYPSKNMLELVGVVGAPKQ